MRMTHLPYGTIGRNPLVFALAALLALSVPPTAFDGAAQGGAHCYDRDLLDVGIVLDRSGSMGTDRMEAAKDGAQIMVGMLGGSDQSGLVDYDNTVTLNQPLGFDHAATDSAIETLFARGSTATGDAIAVSHQDFLDNGRFGSVRPIMVLLTDGFTNAGQDPVVAAAAAKADGIEIYAIGVGSNVNTAELQQIASDPVSTYYHNPITNQDMIDVFSEIASDITRNDLEDPSVGISVPAPGHLYVNGIDHGPGSGPDPAVGMVVGALPFVADADDDCWLENVAFTTDPAVGWSYAENATHVITPPFDCGQVPVGDYDLHVTATDWVGNQTPDVVPFRCATLDGTALSLAAWAGTTVPVSAEYQSTGARRGDDGHTETRAVNVQATTVPLTAIAAEESATRVTNGTLLSTSGTNRLAEADLLGGLVHVEALHADASVSYDVATMSTDWSSDPYIGRVVVAGVEHVVAPGGQDIPLPGGGFVRLMERTVDETAGGVLMRENLVHVYLEDSPYGRGEIILGSLVLQAGLSPPPLAQQRLILDQDDAGSNADAGDDLASAHPVDPGVYHGSLPGADSRDVYRFPAVHGEKITAAIGPAARAVVTGGGALIEEAAPPLESQRDVFPPDVYTSPTQGFELYLYDPDGDLREHSTIGVGHAPQRLELNADEDGDWFLEIVRASPSHVEANNYTMALAITPVPLLPQNDALSMADAPATCVPGGGAAPMITNGTWPGVLRDDDWADVYAFEAQIGHVVAATLKPGETADGVDMRFQMYDRDCVLIDESDLFGHAAGTGLKGAPEAVLAAPAPLTGTYYLRIERINGVGNHYTTLSIQDPMPSALPHDGGTGNDAPADSDVGPEMTAPVFQGRLHEGDTGDGYRIPLEGDRRTFVGFQIGATNLADVTLRDPGGVVVEPAQQTPDAAQAILWDFMAVAGTYTLEVRPVVGGGDYTVEVVPTADVSALPLP